MAQINLEHEKLIEQLTLDSVLEPAVMPPYGGWNTNATWTDRWHSCRGGFDKLYRNQEGKLHRLYGPAYISREYNAEMWFKDGEYHREGGPAVIHNGNTFWYYEGKLHRTDGPAVDSTGEAKQYWIHGQQLSPKNYKKEIARRQRKGHYGY